MEDVKENCKVAHGIRGYLEVGSSLIWYPETMEDAEEHSKVGLRLRGYVETGNYLR